MYIRRWSVDVARSATLWEDILLLKSHLTYGRRITKPARC